MRTSFATTLTVVLAFGCADHPTIPTAPSEAAPTTELTMSSRVVHHVSMGGADLCETFGAPTGCDANFSLVANQTADGTATGQWQDAFGGGEGIHVAVDCLNVAGNTAVIGGVITSGTAGGEDVSGQRALTAVRDNGRSANDPADEISISFFPTGAVLCTDLNPANAPLFPLTNGQVTVW